MIIQNRCLADIFSKMNNVRLSLQGKQLSVFVPMIKFEFSSKNFKTYLMKLVVILTKMIFLTLYNRICQHIVDLCNSVNQYLPNDQCMMLQYHAGIEDPFQVKNTKGF